MATRDEGLDIRARVDKMLQRLDRKFSPEFRVGRLQKRLKRQNVEPNDEERRMIQEVNKRRPGLKTNVPTDETDYHRLIKKSQELAAADIRDAAKTPGHPMTGSSEQNRRLLEDYYRTKLFTEYHNRQYPFNPMEMPSAEKIFGKTTDRLVTRIPEPKPKVDPLTMPIGNK